MQVSLLNFKLKKMLHRDKLSLCIVALLIIAATGCKKDFLDKNPLKDPSSATFWTSEDDVKAGLAGGYARLQADFLGYPRVYLDGLSDNAYADPGNAFLSNLPLLTTGGINAALSAGSPMGAMYSTPYR